MHGPIFLLLLIVQATPKELACCEKVMVRYYNDTHADPQVMVKDTLDSPSGYFYLTSLDQFYQKGNFYLRYLDPETWELGTFKPGDLEYLGSGIWDEKSLKPILNC